MSVLTDPLSIGIAIVGLWSLGIVIVIMICSIVYGVFKRDGR